MSRRQGCGGEVLAQASEVSAGFGGLTARRWLLPLAVLLLLALAAGQARADGPNRAGLVVRFDDGRVYTTCVGFSEDSLTGLQVLQRSGLTVGRGFGGGAVCRIADVGCEGDNCFCQCTGADCRYWAYFRLGPDGTWKYSQVGAGEAIVRDGDVEGWSWGPGVKAPPPAISFGEICALQEARIPAPASLNSPVPTAPITEAVPPASLPAASTLAKAVGTPTPAEVTGAWAPMRWAGVPASYGVFVLLVLGLVGVLVALPACRQTRRPGRAPRR